MMTTPKDDTDWFSAAIATPTTSHFVEADGCPIHHRLWPGNEDDSRRGMLFVHGSAAHSHWWDHIAPSFSAGHAVAALDLAGMRESGRRAHYTIQSFADEIAAVLYDADFIRPDHPRPIVIAHSFGAFAAAHLAAARHDLIGGFVIVDSHLRQIIADQVAHEVRKRLRTSWSGEIDAICKAFIAGEIGFSGVTDAVLSVIGPHHNNKATA